MSTEVVKHVHKLKKHTYSSGRAVYYCVNDCNFKIAVPLSLGKKVLCWRCNKPFAMNEYSLRLVKPHCNDCKKSKEVADVSIPSTVSIPTIPATVNDLKSRLETLLRSNDAERQDDLL